MIHHLQLIAVSFLTKAKDMDLGNILSFKLSMVIFIQWLCDQINPYELIHLSLDRKSGNSVDTKLKRVSRLKICNLFIVFVVMNPLTMG